MVVFSEPSKSSGFTKELHHNFRRLRKEGGQRRLAEEGAVT